MAAALKLLITQRDGGSPLFRITPEGVSAALARATAAMPPLDIIYADPDAQDYAHHLRSAFAVLGYHLPTGLIRAEAKALRLVQLNSAGLEHLLPLDWLPAGAVLATASGIHAAKLREWAGMVFMILHARMPHFMTAQRRHIWAKAYCGSIRGTAALIYGTGALGQAVAAAARRLGIETIGVRRSAKSARGFTRVIGQEEACALAGRVDFVVLTTPLTPLTRHMVDETFLARLRPGCGLANFGRGGLIDQTALIAALGSGQLGGAVIDVTEPEPLPDTSPLWDTPNLIITPHVSCDDPATYVAQVLDVFVDNIARCVAGRPLRNRVVPNRAY